MSQHRYLVPAAVTAMCTALVPLAANAAQTGGGQQQSQNRSSPIQIQVPNQTGPNRIQIGANGGRGGAAGGIQIHVPQPRNSTGSSGGIHIRAPQSNQPMVVNGQGAGNGVGRQAGGVQLQSNASGSSVASNGPQHLGTVRVTPNGSNGSTSNGTGSGGQNGAGPQVATNSNPVAANPAQVQGQPLQKWVGDAVYNTAGQNIGSVHGFVIDHNRVTYAVIETGASFFGLIGGKLVAVPVTKLTFNSQKARLQASISQQQFQNLPAYHPDQHQNQQSQVSR